jgi:hypothetical protein
MEILQFKPPAPQKSSQSAKQAFAHEFLRECKVMVCINRVVPAGNFLTLAPEKILFFTCFACYNIFLGAYSKKKKVVLSMNFRDDGDGAR